MILLLPQGYLEMVWWSHVWGATSIWEGISENFGCVSTPQYFGACLALRSLSSNQTLLSLGVCIADLHGGTVFYKSVFSVLTKRKWVRVRKFGPSPLRMDGLATPQIRMQGILFGVAVIPHLSPDSHLAKLALR